MTLIVLNFKTYRESTGSEGLALARICQEMARENSLEMVVVPQVADISNIAAAVSIPVFSQHVDGVGYGGFTGHITAASLKGVGAAGSLINHSERRLRLAEIEASIAACGQAGLKSIVCTNNVATTRAAAAMGPDYVAIEPPELIGSGIPVSKSDPEIVSNSVQAVKRIAPDVGVLCGAGITHGEDLKAALDLGSQGVLLASGIIKAKDQRKALQDLVAGAR
jgi:triosephosphate isomerase